MVQKKAPGRNPSRSGLSAGGEVRIPITSAMHAQDRIDPILVESAFAAQNLDAHGLQFLQRARGCDARQGTGLQFLYGLIEHGIGILYSNSGFGARQKSRRPAPLAYTEN